MNKAVLIHANWCGICQALAPAWEEAKSLMNDNVSIIEIEYSDPYKVDKIKMLNDELNGNSQIEVHGYPTMFKINNNTIEYYQKERTPQEMAKFFNNTPNNSFVSKQPIKRKSLRRKKLTKRLKQRRKKLTKRMKQRKNNKSRKSRKNN